MNLEISNLLDLSHTLAGDYLKQFQYPWQALDGIKELILTLGAGPVSYTHLPKRVSVIGEPSGRTPSPAAHYRSNPSSGKTPLGIETTPYSVRFCLAQA